CRILRDLTGVRRNVVENPVDNRKESQARRRRVPIHGDESIRFRAGRRACPLNIRRHCPAPTGEIDGHFLLVLKIVARNAEVFSEAWSDTGYLSFSRWPRRPPAR